MKYYGIYPAIVIQNNDPEKCGRVKVFIPGITNTIYENWNSVNVDKEFSNINDSSLSVVLKELRDELPWATNVSPFFGGGSTQLRGTALKRPSGSFSIPNVGAHTFAFFIAGDVNAPAFFGINHGVTEWSGALSTDYPSAIENGGAGAYVNKHIINTNKHYVEFVDNDGSEEIRIFSYKDRKDITTNDENISVGANRNTTIGVDETLEVGVNRLATIGGNDTLTIHGKLKIEVDDDIDINSKGNIKITATTSIALSSTRIDLN